LRIKRTVKAFGLVFIGLCAIFMSLLYINRPHTPPFKDERGRIIPESVASLEKVRLGGLDQWICLRGKRRTNPLLLFLHGGPGMPMMYLAHTFQRPLEEHFVCVQWDQRGAGKSYSKTVPEESMNVEQILADAVELIGKLKRRFRQQKIYLVGHSWGTYTGILLVQRHPELFEAYVGVGQVVDEQRSRKIADRFIKEQGQKSGNQKALDEMARNPDDSREKWLFAFGGELHGETSYMPFIKAGFMAPEYSLFDIPKVASGSSFSSQHMKYNAISGPIIQNVLVVNVPVYFFIGRYDYTTPFELVEQYYEQLESPKKRLVWFDYSAHFPFFEEPQEFARKMVDIVRAGSLKSETN
jgi:pimeloyl-ACP methyl ester carboxylesterase